MVVGVIATFTVVACCLLQLRKLKVSKHKYTETANISNLTDSELETLGMSTSTEIYNENVRLELIRRIKKNLKELKEVINKERVEADSFISHYDTTQVDLKQIDKCLKELLSNLSQRRGSKSICQDSEEVY